MYILLHCTAMREIPNPVDLVLHSLVAPRYNLQFPALNLMRPHQHHHQQVLIDQHISGKFIRTNPLLCHQLCLTNCQYQTQVPKLENHPSYLPWQSVERGRSLPRTTQNGQYYSAAFSSTICRKMNLLTRCPQPGFVPFLPSPSLFSEVPATPIT